MVLVRGGITVKPHVQRAADEVVDVFGPGLSPGTYNGHSPPEGPTQALDLFNPETQAGWALQNRVADYLIKHAKRLGVRYVIKWNPNGNDWIWNIERADEGWRAMATRDHRNHVHVTFYARAEVELEPEEEDEMVYYGDSPDGREYAFWMVFGMFKKKLHTSVVWEEAQVLAKKMGLSPPKHVGKIPVATFDGLIDVDDLVRKGDDDGD